LLKVSSYVLLNVMLFLCCCGCLCPYTARTRDVVSELSAATLSELHQLTAPDVLTAHGVQDIAKCKRLWLTDLVQVGRKCDGKDYTRSSVSIACMHGWPSGHE